MGRDCVAEARSAAQPLLQVDEHFVSFLDPFSSATMASASRIGTPARMNDARPGGRSSSDRRA